MLRFHLDENMPVYIATGLRKRGINISISKEANLISAPDEDQLAYAFQCKRVLITRDQDFLRLHSKDIHHYGIIFWTQKQSAGRLIQNIDVLSKTKTEIDMIGQLLFL